MFASAARLSVKWYATHVLESASSADDRREPHRLLPLDADEWIPLRRQRRRIETEHDRIEHGMMGGEREYFETHLDVSHRRCDQHHQPDLDESLTKWAVERRRMGDERRCAGGSVPRQ